MGGIGSGRRYQGGAPTTEDVRSVDIRWLHRQCNLLSLGTRTISWSRCGVPNGSVRIERSPVGLVFWYSLTPAFGRAIGVKRLVEIEWTETRFSGRRPWFRCPACARRVAAMFISTTVACRKCLGVRYPSQNESACDRAIRRLDFLREKLRWQPGFLNGPGSRPKGMHHRTYRRVLAEYASISRFVNTSVAMRLGLKLGYSSDELPGHLEDIADRRF